MADGARGIAVRGAALALAMLLLPGCTDQTKVHEAELSELLAVLPGHYDNTAQVEADARNHANAPHDAVALTITHVFTPRLGHHVYYAQESAADDPRRVFSEKMYSFTVDEKRGIVETLYEFVEPLRWRDGQHNKDLFTSLQGFAQRGGDKAVREFSKRCFPLLPAATQVEIKGLQQFNRRRERRRWRDRVGRTL